TRRRSIRGRACKTETNDQPRRGMAGPFGTALIVAPMRLEIASDAAMTSTLLRPALRNARFSVAVRTIWRMLVARIALRVLIFAELCRRIAVSKRLARPI